MTFFQISIPERIRISGKTVDIESILLKNTWKVFDAKGNNQVFSFRSNGELLVSENGKEYKGFWSFIPSNMAVVLSAKDDLKMLHPVYEDSSLMALQQDGTSNVLFLIKDKASATLQLNNPDQIVSYLASMEKSKESAKTEVAIPVPQSKKEDLQTYKIQIPEKLKLKEELVRGSKIFSANVWDVFREDSVKQVIVFKDDGESYVSTDGDIVKGYWSFAIKNNTVFLSTKDDLTKFNLIYLDSLLMVLQKVGSDDKIILMKGNTDASAPAKTIDDLNAYFLVGGQFIKDVDKATADDKVVLSSQPEVQEKVTTPPNNIRSSKLTRVNIEQRVKELSDSMVAVGKHIDEVTKWLSDNQKKAIDGNSWGDWMTGALFGGGLIGMAISKKVRTGKKSTKVIYNGMTADDMGQDIVNQVTKLVDYQCEIQSLVGKEEENYYYNLVDFVFQYGYKYHMAWMYFTSYYCTNHKVEYNGVKMTLEEMIRKQWFKEMLRMDMKDETRKAIEKACK